MSWVSCRGTCRGCKNLRQACRRGSATGHIHARVDRDLAHQKKSLTDRELITLAGQHDRRGLLLDDKPEGDFCNRDGSATGYPDYDDLP